MTMKKKRQSPKKTTIFPVEPKKTGDLYRDYFENSAIATAIIEEDGIFSRVNSRFEQLSGYTRDEIEGKKSWTELVVPDDVEKLNRYTQDLMKPNGQVPPTCSFSLRDKSGRTLAMLVSIKRLPGTRQAIASLTENSVQKKLEEMLRATESRYRTLVNDIPVGVYRNKLEQPGRFLWGNTALVRMYGFDSLAELLKNPVLNVYADPKDRDRFIHELTTQGFVRNFEVLHKRKDGSHFWGRVTAQPKKNRDGNIEWIEGTVEDLTAERTARETGGQKNRLTSAAFNSTAGIGICITDLTGTLTLVNRNMEQMLGYSSEELVGKRTPLFFHCESELTARSQLLSSETGRIITGFEILTMPVQQAGFDEREWTYIHKDTRELRIHLTITPLLADGGEQLGYLLTAKEVSGIRQLEEVFRSSYLQMSGVIYNLPDATFAIDQEGKVIAWNRAMEDSTGVKAVDILGKGNYEYSLTFYGSRRPLLIDLITAPDAKIRDWGYSAIRRKGNALMAEAPSMDAHNNLRVIWGLAAPIFDTEGNRVGAIESIADVTESRNRESALEDSLLKFREILDNIGAATIIIEEDDTISFINPEFGRILGYVREEIEGKKKWMEFVVPEDVRGLEVNWKRGAQWDEGPIRFEVRFIRWDGEIRNALLTINRIPKTEKLVVAIMDITEKIRAENAIQMANRKLNFLNGIIRHDILNQLTVLKGNLELTREYNADPDQGAILDKEITATDAIQSLITFTRDYQDIGIEPPEWQDVRTTVMKSCTEIRLGEISLSVEIGGVEIYADRLLSSVFFNLVRNAINHGKKTTRIRIFCQESFEELHIVCEDDGIGVPPEVKEKIFNRQFFNLTGIQMYLAREILSITGISIRETGIYGTGACFEIRVPKGGYRFIAAQE